jgi:hypothetical protein
MTFITGLLRSARNDGTKSHYFTTNLIKTVAFGGMGVYNVVMNMREGSVMQLLRGFSRRNPVVDLFITGLLRFARNDKQHALRSNSLSLSRQRNSR